MSQTMSVNGTSGRVPEMEVEQTAGNEPERVNGGRQDVTDSIMEVDKMSDDYLRQLVKKLTELRNKLNGEKELNLVLQDAVCELQGRVSVNYQRSEELGIQSFKDMMCQANQELDSTKQDGNELLTNVLSECRKLIENVIIHTGEIEKPKLGFKTNETVVESFDAEVARSEELKKNMDNLNCEVGDLQESKKRAAESFAALENSKSLMEYLTEEKRIVESDILCMQIQLKKFLQSS